MKKILVIDNYDSFVHNAVQLLRESSEPVNITIQLNDRIDFEKFGDYDGILLSPGPGIPEEEIKIQMNAMKKGYNSCNRFSLFVAYREK